MQKLSVLHTIPAIPPSSVLLLDRSTAAQDLEQGAAEALGDVRNRSSGRLTCRNVCLGVMVAVTAVTFVGLVVYNLTYSDPAGEDQPQAAALVGPSQWEYPFQQSGSRQARMQLGLHSALSHGLNVTGP
ncbi:hypothetical protein [Stenotrophomonas sp. NPDC077659]|uniref:hypothetical protein n=1 Tax=Stenotrophomonas sp. NPDC077659 TaxID=3390694 RepID=UPI003D077A45